MKYAAWLMAWFLMPGLAWGWNNTGHIAVAKLAWDQLSAQQRQDALALLAEHPHFETFFKATPKPANVSDAEYFFTIASVWPDWLRGYAKSKDAEGKKTYLFHKGPRHYINWPFVRPSDKEMFQDKTLTPDTKENIILGLDTVRAELKSEKFSPKYKAVSLCWLLHLTGDIHQPLHNIGMYTKYTPMGDQGGNLFWVKVDDVPIRLHAYWDNLLGKEEALAQAYQKAASHVELLTRADFQRDQYMAELERKKVEQWSKEGLQLAIDVGYRQGNLKGWLLTRERESEEQKGKAPPLPNDYAEQAQKVAQRQVALAGHRLVDLLKEVLPGK